MTMFKPEEIKKDFPILSKKVNGKKLVYLDNAATSQKPTPVVDSIVDYYFNSNANVHRGVHFLSDKSTEIFEQSKLAVAHFFGAKFEELIFVRNTTEAINGVAYGWGELNVSEGDVILVSTLDHHSNIVVWQELCKRKKANLVFVGLTKDGKIDLEDLKEKLEKFADKVKLVALPHVSNALGSVVNVAEVAEMVRKVNPVARVLVDGAQSAPHIRINFSDLGADFFVFSGHKMLGPMGIGGLLVRDELLQSEEMRPWLFGGGMISEVHESHTNFHDDLSERFVAGTPDVASAVGLATACEYLKNFGMDEVLKHDQELVQYTLKKLAKVEGLEIVGPQDKTRIGSVSFLIKGVHAHDVAQVLDSEGIAVRSGHHCTMPLHSAAGWVATTRVSFQVYNTKEDVDVLIEGLKKVREVLL